MTDYTTNLKVENEEDLVALADGTKSGSVKYEDWQEDNNARAGRGAVAVQAYLERFDKCEPLETVISDMFGDLMHLCDAVTDEDGERVDFYYLIDRAQRDHEAEINGVV